MRVVYFDCFSGISGDMILGGFVDLGVKVEEIVEEIEKIKLPKWGLEIKEEEREGVWGKKVKIEGGEKLINPTETISLLKKSKLNEWVKEKSIKAFNVLLNAEAKIHHTSREKVKFHELGEIDSIVDIVGSIFCVWKLGIQKVYSSPIPVGKGFIQVSHGKLPVPAPVTVELLKRVPIYRIEEVDGEITTPTGIAILQALGCRFGEFPQMRVSKIGYGVGSRKHLIPNLLRILIGRLEEKLEKDKICIVETNIDDMNPEFYDYLIEQLHSAGALDVCLLPVYMKKSRPGIIVKVISPEDKVEEISKIIFKNTTSLGVRILPVVQRLKLHRKEKKLITQWGEVRVKIAFLEDKIVNVSPEYEDCKLIAKKYNLSIKEVYNKIMSDVNKGV